MLQSEDAGVERGGDGMSENLLKTKKCSESVQTITIESKESLLKQINDHFDQAKAFVLFKDKALFGMFKNDELSFSENYDLKLKMIEEMRVFNDEKELYLYRKNNALFARLREDSETGNGEEREYVISKIALWGTEAKKLENNWTRLSEDRGITLTIPFVPEKKVDEHHPVFIVVHSYIEYLNGVQASYCDSRFVRFTEGGEVNE